MTGLSFDKPGVVVIEGHVQGLSNTRSLGEAGIPVIVVDRNNCIARYSKFCKTFFRCPSYEDDIFADFLIELAEQIEISGWILMPSNDHAVLTLSRNKERLEDHYKVITPSLDIINKIYDKSCLLRTAKSIGVDIPSTYFTEDKSLDGFDLSFPVIIKGRQGLDFYRSTGQKANLAVSLEELKKCLLKIEKTFPASQTFIQEIIPNSKNNYTISFTAFCDNGIVKAHWAGEKLREHPYRFGTATFAQSISHFDLLDVVTLLMSELQYTGVCEIEFIQDPRDGIYKLIEINARTWLWVGLAKACGVDYACMIYNYFYPSGNEYPASYTTGIKWINWITDILFSLPAIVRRRFSLRDYLRSIRGEKVDALWQRNDIMPFFAYLFLSVRFLRDR